MSNKKVLVVDDDPINRKLIVKILSKKGFEAIEAGNGVEAFTALENNDVDLILLDIVMPVMDGIEFLKEIKTKPAYINLPIVILTTDDSKKMEAKDLGADDVIIKPVSAIELLETIERLFNKP
ncbi:response regulator DrrA [Nautilia profundicola AmH]|uniref:Response regulator DrrA n=1 Tax=Nautilia profundicola (strain ATCC BAA-1463 / DSM 18972 / AmH) TaxID=598659 RepID=B9L5N0_NAUPA|nr:response regulator [Nautilia profundicola]ACM92445.1 response regulator DrrA [Nautilia profundicola AmH]